MKHSNVSLVLRFKNKTNLRGLELLPESTLRRTFFEFERYQPNTPFALTPSEIWRAKQILKVKNILCKTHRHRLPGCHDLPNDAIFDPMISPEWTLGYSQPDLITSSVVIPCHNTDGFLTNVVRHLTLQDFDLKKVEIIIVDDGSRVSPSRDIFSFAQFHSELNIKYFYWPKKTLGLYRAGQARNLGAANAMGSDLIFLDSDMISPPHFLQDASESLKKWDLIQFVRHHVHPEKSTSAVHISAIKKEDTFIEEENYWKPFFETNDWSSLRDHWKYTCTYGLAVKKSAFWLMGGFSPNYVSYGFEDTEIGYKFAKAGKTFLLHPTKLYHLSRPGQSSHTGSRHAAIAKSAKVFYQNFMDDELYHLFRSLLSEPMAPYWRLISRIRQAAKRSSLRDNNL